MKAFEMCFNGFIEMAIPRIGDYEEARASMFSLTSKVVTPLLERIYDQFFTDSELDAFLSFLKTPEGRNIAKKNPDFVVAVNAASTAALLQVQKSFSQIMNHFLAAQNAPPIN
jgi:hypothetical protein